MDGGERVNVTIDFEGSSEGGGLTIKGKKTGNRGRGLEQRLGGGAHLKRQKEEARRNAELYLWEGETS